MKQYTYPLPPKCAIETVTIRETFGIDEDEAMIEAEMSGADVRDELISLSIVAVNGKECPPGTGGFERWPSKTRSVVKKLFNRINNFTGPEVYKLIEEAEESGTEVVDGQVETTFKFPDKCGLTSITLREMMETDERIASAAGKDISEVMITRCVTRTNRGDGLTMATLRALNTRTRNIITIYWTGMNFIDDDEIVPLALAAEATQDAAQESKSVETSEKPSSQNGSSSPTEAPADSPSPSPSSEASPA